MAASQADFQMLGVLQEPFQIWPNYTWVAIVSAGRCPQLGAGVTGCPSWEISPSTAMRSRAPSRTAGCWQGHFQPSLRQPVITPQTSHLNSPLCSIPGGSCEVTAALY